ncbi:GDP-mannose 4,6-dehydratase [Zobellia nedashkovskayae]
MIYAQQHYAFLRYMDLGVGLDMAAMLFAYAINEDKAINVFNKGEMQRDFTFIDDIVEGVVKLAIEPTKIRVAKVEIFNIGNFKPVHLMDFIGGLEEALGKKVIKIFKPMQDGDVKVTFADASKLQAAIGYKPKIDLKTGLFRFIDWFKEYYKA